MHMTVTIRAGKLSLNPMHRKSQLIQYRTAFRFSAVLAATIALGDYGANAFPAAQHRKSIRIRQQRLDRDSSLTQRGINRCQRVAKRHHRGAIDKRALD